MHEQTNYASLAQAAKNCRFDALSKMLEMPGSSWDPNAKEAGHSALMWAAWFEEPKAIEELLRLPGIMVDQLSDPDQDGSHTALWLAAQEGYSECVELLLRAGANAGYVRSDGLSLLQNAMAHGYCERSVALLQEALRARTPRP